MCSSVKDTFVYAKNTAHFLLYDCFLRLQMYIDVSC